MIEDNLYTFKAKCTNVVDGDTVDVTIDFGFHVWANRRLRLLNVDTPERGHENYTEATDFVKSKILNKDVLVQTYKDDSFGRYLANVYFETSDGSEYRSLNEVLKSTDLLKPDSKWNENTSKAV